ncbi:MAG: 30S ribosomal protein S13 [Methanoculleus bourgensis]|jgi:small subunit ribosomal protein S13|uniref:Small ribosomal subunit protein uS13 n=1 Tax=Methanoculleus bourgensis TaxID=83986 RepID=A0A0X3BIH0_9EURY|nr:MULTISPECIES: 30S ribosomal protein S13 [Methanoculleus]MDD3373667.1 30S ribosomal protein S13 [Methanoculleus bourgensis]NMA87866.1 30S ribosomal protein S13 [Methanoculleus bourgensis]NQS77766.1 30S ribosomal protein S13 [Methanoculleus bourgensis]CVK31966.1 30S ribosomal protein S13 [Methanoculleus bourgensis]SAI87737.1 30S ribosomal protein S13P [Methanoculleus bourgensis]
MDEEEIKYFVRIRNTDLDGTKAVHIALTGIKGIGPHTSRTITALADVDPRAVLGKLDDGSVERLANAVDTYTEQVPDWMINRPKDVYTGEGRHLLGTDLSMTNDDDVNRMRKMRSYRGIRHETGQKVRGQRTKASGRTGTTVGVSRKKE